MAFTNKNVCKNFTETVGSSVWVELNANGVNKGAGGAGQECSEVMLWMQSGGGQSVETIQILDRWDAAGEDNAVVVPEDTPITFMGLTNCNDLSAKTGSGTATLSYRTHYFSGTNLAVS